MNDLTDSATMAWPGIGRPAEVLGEIEHILPERRAVERAGEQPDDEAQAVALVLADRHQQALVHALGIGERLAFAVDHPADRHLLAALRLEPHLAECRDGRRHVEHDRRLFAGRNGDADRVGAEQVLHRAPGRQMVVAADREIDADHVVSERHHGIERGGTGVIAHARADPGDASAAWPSRSPSGSQTASPDGRCRCHHRPAQLTDDPARCGCRGADCCRRPSAAGC